MPSVYFVLASMEVMRVRIVIIGIGGSVMVLVLCADCLTLFLLSVLVLTGFPRYF